MLNFLPLILIFLGLGGLIILFSRHKKEIQEQNEIFKEVQNSNARFSLIKNKLIVFSEQLKVWLIHFLEKVFHRLRLSTLRLENFLSQSLKNIKQTKEAKTKEEKVDILAKIKELNEPLSDSRLILAETILKFEEEEKRLLELFKKNSKDLEVLKNLARLYLNNFDWSDARFVLLSGFHFAPQDKTIQSLMIELWEKEEKSLERSS